ncbi:hypothetical protein QA640_39915 [Bradyrhizobium sp. CB82]|uniref:hypothetical protein n=1 Tax=Bradyrhizobium sp. CB82 TaxID=3039159 RepID=UPI0024B1F13B|nr:hypothetical protein [Bradyrhizobium sp. CB82]WFU40293.1 hypothetical protein QA640_39915 [Bradyrhizobium sp. CB82]
MPCNETFNWVDDADAEPRLDLISMMAHSPATRNMDSREFLGNLILLIVGGNDTKRNSISGGLLFTNQNPSELRKLRDNPMLLSSAVSEIMRWQTSIARRRGDASQVIFPGLIGGALTRISIDARTFRLRRFADTRRMPT